MRIVHWAPFAPNRCGLYEAARDMVRADTVRGHEVAFCDTGISPGYGQRDPGQVGARDDRGGFVIATSDPRAPEVLGADLWVCHDGVPGEIEAMSAAPVVWMVHGRPLACFRPEQEGRPGTPYSIIPALAARERVKALVTMWREFVPHWRPLVGDKLRCTDDPPVDRARFREAGPARALDPAKRGRRNLLICDSWRDDIDVYEVSVAALEAARQRPGTRVHWWAVEPDKQGPWQHLWRAFDEIGALGEIHPRETDMDHTYRAMDMLVTPHVIGVRTVAEALCCGLPVVAGEGCRYTPYTGRVTDAARMADAIVRCLDDLEANPVRVRVAARRASRAFDLDLFGRRMEAIYQHATGAAAPVMATASALQEAA